MNQDCEDLNHLANEEDTAIAYALADALSKDNVEKFLQLYDEIPASVSPQRVRLLLLIFPRFTGGSDNS